MNKLHLLALGLVGVTLVGAGCGPQVLSVGEAQVMSDDVVFNLEHNPKSVALYMRDTLGAENVNVDTLVAEFAQMRTENGFMDPSNITVTSVEDGVKSDAKVKGAKSFSNVTGTFTCGEDGKQAGYQMELAYSGEWETWLLSGLSIESCK
jgi:hypothetical protein